MDIVGDERQAEVFADWCVYMLVGYEQATLSREPRVYEWISNQMLDALDSAVRHRPAAVSRTEDVERARQGEPVEHVFAVLRERLYGRSVPGHPRRIGPLHHRDHQRLGSAARRRRGDRRAVGCQPVRRFRRPPRGVRQPPAPS